MLEIVNEHNTSNYIVLNMFILLKHIPEDHLM